MSIYDQDSTTLRADWRNHKIEGYAAAAGRYGDPAAFFEAPLFTHVEGNLWQGGCIDGVRLPDDFDYVISLYPWEKYELGEMTERREFKQYDRAGTVDEDAYDEIVDIATSCVMHGKTLIHCQAGLNRSGYVAARVLMEGGRSPQEAIDLLRETRSPLVLCNKDLEQHLFEIATRRIQ